MIHAGRLSQNLWAEAVNTAAYVINRTEPGPVKDKSPYELWTGKRAELDHLNVFGRTVYSHIPDQHRKKFDVKAQKCILVGYPDNQKGYKVLGLGRNRVDTVRNVSFDDPHKQLICVTDDDNGPEVGASDTDEEPEFFASGGGECENSESNNLPTDDQIPVSNDRQCGISEENIRPNRLRSGAMAAISGNWEPNTFREADESNQREQWRAAMAEEIEALHENKTWELVPNTGQKLVDCRWTYKIKYKASGEVDRYKARLVARGFTQRFGVDYVDTFSPVIRMESVRAILAIASARKCELGQFDVKTAFLNGELQETIHMKQPPGFDDGTDRVCRLKKSLYGLKQASRCWNITFVSELRRLQLKQCRSDPCVFVRSSSPLLIVGIYVDDGIIVAEREEDLSATMTALALKFKMSSCTLGLFLGMEITRSSDGTIKLTISQRMYTEKLLEQYRMSSAHPVSTPCICNPSDSVVSLKNGTFPYREAIGSLLYLACLTRPDITYAVGLVSRYQENPTQENVEMVKRIMRYLRGTMGAKLMYVAGWNLELSIYSDSDHAGDHTDRKSTSGYACLLG